MSEKEPQKIWTPPTPLDTNTQRMAWTMFLEWWKTSSRVAYERKAEGLPAFKKTTIADCYADCLQAAKLVRQLEIDAGGA